MKTCEVAKINGGVIGITNPSNARNVILTCKNKVVESIQIIKKNKKINQNAYTQIIIKEKQQELFEIKIDEESEQINEIKINKFYENLEIIDYHSECIGVGTFQEFIIIVVFDEVNAPTQETKIIKPLVGMI